MLGMLCFMIALLQLVLHFFSDFFDHLFLNLSWQITKGCGFLNLFFILRSIGRFPFADSWASHYCSWGWYIWVVKERIIFGVLVWVFGVCDFFRIYEVLDFMFKAHAGVSRVFEVLVEFAVLVWVIVWGVWVWWVWIR